MKAKKHIARIVVRSDLYAKEGMRARIAGLCSPQKRCTTARQKGGRKVVNWQKVAIEDLRKYPALKQSLVSIREKQIALDMQSGVVRSSFREAIPVTGSGISGAEDKMISQIVERDRLEGNYAAVEKLVAQIDAALSMLTDTERLVLDRFYINRPPEHVERLCEELGYEKSNVYALKDRALYAFTVAMYGILDL